MSERFESRPVAKGTQVTVVVGNEERELKATKAKSGGWAITPADAAEATALAAFSDEALDPPPAPEPEPAPEGEDEAAKDTEEAPTPPESNAEAADGQEETP